VRFAVISDIHGNRLALESVLADIAHLGADAVLNLGDVAAGPMDPLGTLDLLGSLQLPTVRGNHDRWIVERKKDRIDLFVGDLIREQDFAWLGALPATLVVNNEVFLCHGTPTSDTDPWLDNWFDDRKMTLPDEATVTKLADGIDYPILLCGHTHVARSVRLRDGRRVVNPGSVGLPFLYGSPDARYAMVERRGSDWTVELRSVPYDHEGAAKQAEAHGFGHWREALTTGWPGPKGLFD
jgi:predicted phosphodiesterase